jgi:hypothetical protein
MAEYSYTENGVMRNRDHQYIPIQPKNRDYRKFKAWERAGGVADPYEPPPIPPDPDKVENRIAGDLVLRNLIRALAKELGKTEREILDAIRAEASA